MVPRFATGENLLNVLRQSSDLIVAAIGIMFVLLVGGIDMSIGSLYGLTSVVLVSSISTSGNAVVGVLVALGGGAVIGLVNGVIVEKVKVPAFITTLGMSYIALALAQMLSSGGALRVPKDSPFQLLTQANLFGIPMLIVVAALVAALAWYALEHTSFGRSVAAVGYNREASRLAGVRVGAVTISCYVAASLLVAVGAILLTSRIQTGEPTLGGANTTFEVITAAVVGGTSLFGGKGNVIGVLLGAIIIRTIGNCITLLNITPLLYQAVMGSLILVALTAEALRRRYARSDE
jgi:ribose transport system permease protein